MTPQRSIGFLLAVFLVVLSTQVWTQSTIGREVSVPNHLADGEEFSVSLIDLIEHGSRLFTAVWTIQEGGGRPLTKGTGAPVSDPSSPLVFPRDFNRVSAPDANSCAGCHNAPFGLAGGGGDIVANVFVLGQRFDFATFEMFDGIPTRGAADENGNLVTLQSIANSRNTLGMFGSGFIEMLARQITADLQAIRNSIPSGGAAALTSKGISFGSLARDGAGNWITSGAEGLPAKSLVTSGPANPPSLVIRPFHQAGAVVSVREFSNNAFNHHHGIQSTERFGAGADPDGDGFVNEMTQADMTAATIFQATLPVPGRVIPNDPDIEGAVLEGERQFQKIGCATCHIRALPLTSQGWIFTEPNPFNPSGNRRPSDGAVLNVDLTDSNLPGPRLQPVNGIVSVPAFTDLKLHDITSGPNDPNREPLDMQQAAGSLGFLAGNSRFITRKLWGTANEPPFFHHGQFTTLRQAVEAHFGEAGDAGDKFRKLPSDKKDAVIEFLKTLQVLPPGATALIVDEHGNPKPWPPKDGS